MNIKPIRNDDLRAAFKRLDACTKPKKERPQQTKWKYSSRLSKPTK